MIRIDEERVVKAPRKRNAFRYILETNFLIPFRLFYKWFKDSFFIFLANTAFNNFELNMNRFFLVSANCRKAKLPSRGASPKPKIIVFIISNRVVT
jgi:hypothetical protein